VGSRRLARELRGGPTDGSAVNGADTSRRISRGGAFDEVASSLMVHARNWSTPTPHREIGFRLALEP